LPISSTSDGKPNTISSLLCKNPDPSDKCESKSFAEEQLKYPSLQPIIQYLSENILPVHATKTVTQSSVYTIHPLF